MLYSVITMNKTLAEIGIIGGGFVGYGFATSEIIPIFAGVMWDDEND